MEKEKSNGSLMAILMAIILSFFFGTNFAWAASLYFYPSNNTYSAGGSFSSGIYVSSADTAMNATQGVVSFPNDKLEVISLSKSNSIINLWIQEPSFSNRDGTINFGGVATNPGFQGASGKILTVTFRAKDTGRAALSFLSGSVLANDGKGTNILNSLGTAVINVTEATALPTAERTSNLSIVIDSTPPVASGGWYNFDSIEFHWNTPKGATAMNYDISNNPSYELKKTAREIISKTTYDVRGFADGVWYFSVRFKKGNVWGPAAVKSFGLDRTPPEPFVIVRQDNDLTNPRPVFSWTATDKTSGIDYEQIKIGEGNLFNPGSIKSETFAAISYVLPSQSPASSRMLVVRAYDKAGNFRESSTEFSVVPKTSWRAWLYALIQFLSQWGWILVVIMALSVAALYFFIYRLFRWRIILRRELNEFKNELRKDLKRFERQLEVEEKKGLEVSLNRSHIQKARESLQKEMKHIEEDVKKEVEKLDDFPEL